MRAEEAQAALQAELGSEYHCHGAEFSDHPTLTGNHKLFQMIYSHGKETQYVSCYMPSWEADMLKKWARDAAHQIRVSRLT